MFGKMQSVLQQPPKKKKKKRQNKNPQNPNINW